uniref:Spermidine hydroxycinnamoyl transferase-like n=1 Tax=Nelumbo nucifera TaxID=4432 RepID=A0A822YDB7_NELNU|nr:TPA_asm: hypothetical protein HUJ06_028956 [Nelumbo nucifera]
MLSIKSSYTVKPASPTPNCRLWLSDSDQLEPYTHAPTIYFYRSPIGVSPSSAVETMRSSLSQALVQFYPLAGRLQWIDGTRLELDCNAMGVELLEAESENRIDDFGDFRPTPEIRQLIPRVDYGLPINEIPLLLVQLTSFPCGGISIGVAISHSVVDGKSAINFIGAWTKIARGEKPDPTPPFLDRTVLQASGPVVAPRFDHVEFDSLPHLIGRPDDKEERAKETTVEMFKLTKEQVEKLKSKANEGRTKDSGRAYTRYEAIAGHVWRCACKARAHEREQLTKVRIIVDCRNRLNPPLPQGYFGNAIVPTIATARSGDLMDQPLGYAAGKIREAVVKMTDEYVRSAIDFLRSQPDLMRFRTSFHSVGCSEGGFFGNPNLTITSWLGLAIYEGDFGWGRPIYMGPGLIASDGKCSVLSGGEDGSLAIPLGLQVAHVDAFKELFYEDIM